jgi:hypothetical protein
MCLWLLATLAATLAASELEARDPTSAEFDADKLAAILPVMERHIEEGKLIAIYMVQINPTGPFDFSGEMKRLVYASME